jgi:hypothetical protein
MENLRRPRVHATYFQRESRFLTGADLFAAQFNGYLTYAAMQESMGREGSLSQRLAREFRAKAETLRKRFNTEWWNVSANRFYSAMLQDRTFAAELTPECNTYALLFGIPEEGAKTEASLDTAENSPPQFPGAYSYTPEILYRYERNEHAYKFLLDIAGPNFFGKDQGEVPFAVVGAVATGLMGLQPDAPKSSIQTFPRLTDSLKWAKLVRVPVLRNEITVEHRGTHETTLANTSGPSLEWKVSFPIPEGGQQSQIVIDGAPVRASIERRSVLSATVPVAPGQSRSARYLA